MKSLIFFLNVLLILFISSCQPKTEIEGLVKVKAIVETQAVSAGTDDDAADDPAIWYNLSEPEKSLIIGSDKTDGIDVFTLEGKLVKSYPFGRINNVDLRQNLIIGNSKWDIIGGSNRTLNNVGLWKVVNVNGDLEPCGSIATQMPDVYGFCMYRSPKTQKVYALVNSKTGKVEQYELTGDSSQIKGVLVRSLQLESQVEGMVADDSLATLFVGVEEKGVYVFDAEPDGSTQGKLIKGTSKENPAISFDVEGLALYELSGTDGYLIVSSQGNNTYAVYSRSANYDYLGSFEIIDGKIDGVSETDGIELDSRPFGSKYPNGLFVCQDGFNFDGQNKVPQNFKLVSWKDIAERFNPKLQPLSN